MRPKAEGALAYQCFHTCLLTTCTHIRRPGVFLSPQQVSALSERLYARAEMKKLHLERLVQQAREQEGNFKPTMFTSSKHRE